MYVKDEYRVLAVETIDTLRKNAASLLELAAEIENGQTTGYPLLELAIGELNECASALVQIEWED